MSVIEKIKIGQTSYNISDANTYASLSPSQRTTLLSSGTYLGDTVQSDTIFETSEGKFENFYDDSETSLTWTATSSGYSAGLFGYFNGLYIAYTRASKSSNKVMVYSTDLENWTNTSTTFTNSAYYVNSHGCFDYFKGRYYCTYFDGSAYILRYSTDLNTWTDIMTETTGAFYIAHSDDYIVIRTNANDGLSGKTYKSSDGLNFTELSQTIPTAGIWRVLYGNGRFLFLTGQTTQAYYTTDLETINAITFPIYYRQGALFDGTNFLITGKESSSSSVDKYAKSPDLVNWTESSGSNVWIWGEMAYNGSDTYIAVGSSAMQISSDGFNWTSQSSNLNDIYYGPSGFMATNDGAIYKGSETTTHDYSLSDLSYSKTQVDSILTSKIDNTATGTDSLTILGTPTTAANAVNIGKSTSVSSASGIAIGKDASSNAIGAIQLGSGTNNETGSLAVGLTTDGTSFSNYKLLSIDGTVPAERLSETVIKNSGAPDTSTSADYEGQGYIDTDTNQEYSCVDISDSTNTWKQIPTIDVADYQPQENFIKVGSPTITDGVVSGFTTSSYYQAPFPITSTMTSFEVVASFTLSGTSGNQAGIMGAYDNWKPGYRLMTNTSNLLSVRTSSTGSTSDIDMTGTTTLVAGTKYWVKTTFDTTNGHKVYLSTDGATWNLEASNSSTARPYANIEYPIMIIGYNAGSGVAFNGSIDLNECYIKVDEEYTWKPYNETFYNNFWQYPNPMTTSIRGVCLDENHIAYGFRNNNALVSNYWITDWNSTPYTVYVKAYSDNWKAKSYNIMMFGYTSSMSARFLYTNTSGIPCTYGISKVGTTALTDSKWYWFKVDYNDDGTKYTKVYTLEDNDYTLDTLPATSSWTQQLSVSGSLWGNYYTTLSHNGSDYFNGKIDTKGWAVERNGDFVWKAISDVNILKEQNVPTIHYGYSKPTITTAGKVGDIYIDKTTGVRYVLTYIGETGRYEWCKTMFNSGSNSVMIGSSASGQYQSHVNGSVSLGTNTYVATSSVSVGTSTSAGYAGTAVGYAASSNGGNFCLALGFATTTRKIATQQIGIQGFNGQASSLMFGGADVLSTSGKTYYKNYPILDYTNGNIYGERFGDSVLKGTTAPTSETIADYIGQTYINTTDSNVYTCVSGATTDNFNFAGDYRNPTIRGIMSGFDGSYRYIHTNSLFTVGSGSYTLVGRFCRDYSQGGYNPIFGAYGATRLVFYDSNGKLAIYDGSTTKTGTTVLTLLQWYWCKVVWDGTNLISYIIADNGYTLDTLPTEGWTQQTSGTVNAFGSKALSIGRSNDGNYMRGLIDLRNCGVIENDVYSWKAIEVTTPYVWDRKVPMEIVTEMPETPVAGTLYFVTGS